MPHHAHGTRTTFHEVATVLIRVSRLQIVVRTGPVKYLTPQRPREALHCLGDHLLAVIEVLTAEVTQVVQSLCAQSRQPMTVGQQKPHPCIPYANVGSFLVRSSGALDPDTEMEVFTTSHGYSHFKQDFKKKKVDIFKVSRILTDVVK